VDAFVTLRLGGGNLVKLNLPPPGFGLVFWPFVAGKFFFFFVQTFDFNFTLLFFIVSLSIWFFSSPFIFSFFYGHDLGVVGF